MSQIKAKKLSDYTTLSVLVADPNYAAGTNMVQMLRTIGFNNVERLSRISPNANLFNEEHFDIIISEQSPPDVDGLALLSRIRSDAKFNKTAFLIVSGALNQSIVVKAIKEGVSEFIVKPFSIRNLQERVNRALTFPIKREQSIQLDADTPFNAEQEDLSTTSLLVVDDVPDNITIISEVLRNDYQLRATTSAEKALKICLSDNPPDLVLLDIMMPDIDGLTLCKKLKAHPKTQHITVIFVTAMNQTKDIVRGFELGAVDYITKPINPAILAVRVKTHVKIINATKALRTQVDIMAENAQLKSKVLG